MILTLEDPAKCRICGGLWSFGTTWLGAVVAIHSLGPCIPMPVAERAQQEESDFETRCEECYKWFVPGKHSASTQLVCGTVCRTARRTRKHRESEIRCKARKAA